MIATVASLLKTRGEFVDRDEPVIEPEEAEGIPAGGPEAAAEAEARIKNKLDAEQRGRH